MRRRVAVLAPLLALQCGGEPQVEPAPARSEAPPSNHHESPEPPSSSEALPTVDPASAEPRSARRQAAIDLLTDGQTAESLAIIATAPGEKFDPRLAEKLTPKVWVSDRPRTPTLAPPLAMVEQGTATIDGPLDHDIVRRIVRAHLNEVRSCYNRGLAKDPKLAGRLTIDFQILATGKVGSSSVAKTTLSDDEVGTCVARMVRRWTFPKPRGGGLVKVSYPFVLKPR
jgi:outer membrane biosynthesis protein TonB